MKLQDVILRAMAKRITWLDAAEIAGLSVRTITRLREKYQTFGYDGLYDQERHKRYVHRVPLSTAETVLALYQETYSGLPVRRFCQKLQKEHGIRLPSTWVRQALLGAGLISEPKKPEAPEPVKLQPRPRRRVVHFVRSASFR